jgi:hypothetical protein
VIIYANDLVSSDIIIQVDDDGGKRHIIIDWINRDEDVDAFSVVGYYEDNGDEYFEYFEGDEMLNILRNNPQNR